MLNLSLRLTQEQPLLRAEVRRPREPFGAREAEVRAQRVAHRVDEPVSAAWREPVLPPDIEHLHAGVGPVDPRLDPADEAVPERDRQHVPAPTSLGGWHEELPHVVEVEQAPKEAAVPDQRIEWGKERDGGRWLRRRFEQLHFLSEDETLAAHALDLDGNDLSELNEVLAQRGPPRGLR